MKTVKNKTEKSEKQTETSGTPNAPEANMTPTLKHVYGCPSIRPKRIIIYAKRPPIQAKRLARTDFMPQHLKNQLRDHGQFFIEEGKGETTRLESVRLDSETERQLKMMQLWEKEEGRNRLKSDIIRQCIHDQFKMKEAERKKKLLSHSA